VRRALAAIALTALAACEPTAAPLAKVWTPREFVAKRAVTTPSFGGWAPSQLVVAAGDLIPFSTRTQLAGEGLTVFPGVAEGRAVGFVITDVWQDHPEPWVQPVYVSTAGAPPVERDVPSVFPVGLDSTFYSPWWRKEHVPLDDDAVAGFTSATAALNAKAARTLGELVLCAIISPETIDVAAAVARAPVHPLTGKALVPPARRDAFVDGAPVKYLGFGPGRAAFEGQRLVESELFVFTAGGEALSAAAVLPREPRAHAFVRRVEVPVPPGARFFVPSNRADLRAGLAGLAPEVDAALDAFPEYALRLARDPACFTAPTFPQGCDWLDSADEVRALPGAVRRPVQLTAAVLPEVTP